MHWSSPEAQVLLGIFADFASLIAITISALGLIWVAGAFRRRRMHTLLGSDHWSGSVEIVVSNIQVRAGGVVSIIDDRVGFVGTAIPQAEYNAAAKLKGVFESRLSIALFKAITNQLGIHGSDQAVRCGISVSPAYARVNHAGDELVLLAEEPIRAVAQAELDKPCTHILIGGPRFNMLTAYVTETRENPKVRIRAECLETGGQINWTAIVCGEPEMPPFTRREEQSPTGTPIYTEYFSIEKIQHFGTGRSPVLLCVGTCTAATSAAVEMLGGWQRLVARFGNNDFSILYELRTSDREASADPAHRSAIFTVRQLWPTEII